MAIYDPTGTDFFTDEDAELKDEVLQRMLDGMPPDLAYSHYGNEIQRVLAYEIERMSAAIWAIRQRAYVELADSDGLEWWERLLGLPPNPNDLTVEQRRNVVSVQMRGRIQFYGKDFRNGLELLGGPIRDTTVVTATGEVSVDFINALTAPDVDRIERYCLTAGPAHLQWTITSAGASSGFIANMTPGDTKYV